MVRGSAPLEGSVRIEGAKNSALKLMAASLMAPGHFVLRNVPHIVDVEIMSDLLLSAGADVRRTEDHILTIDVCKSAIARGRLGPSRCCRGRLPF